MTKNNSAPRAVALVVFAGLLGGTWWLNRKNVTAPVVNESGPPAPAAPDALVRYGFSFTEVAKASGVDFVHTAPKLDPPRLTRLIDAYSTRAQAAPRTVAPAE